MRVKEYLSKIPNNTSVTFIKARARKDASTPYYHAEYQTTPIYKAEEWKDSNLSNYIILNDAQPPIDWLSGSRWNFDFGKGYLRCFLIISPEDMNILYKGEQGERMEKYIETQLQIK